MIMPSPRLPSKNVAAMMVILTPPPPPPLSCGAFAVDDISVSSTHQTDLSTRAPGKKSRRAVCFDLGANETFGPSRCLASSAVQPEQQEDNDESCCVQDRWYSRADYQSFKRDHVSSAKDTIQTELKTRKDSNSYNCLMDHLYKQCCCAAITTEDQESRPVLLSTSDESKLESLVKEQIHRIGQERITVRRIRQDKKSRRDLVLDAVLEIQDTCCHDASYEERSLEDCPHRAIHQQHVAFVCNHAGVVIVWSKFGLWVLNIESAVSGGLTSVRNIEGTVGSLMQQQRRFLGPTNSSTKKPPYFF